MPIQCCWMYDSETIHYLSKLLMFVNNFQTRCAGSVKEKSFTTMIIFSDLLSLWLFNFLLSQILVRLLLLALLTSSTFASLPPSPAPKRLVLAGACEWDLLYNSDIGLWYSFFDNKHSSSEPWYSSDDGSERYPLPDVAKVSCPLEHELRLLYCFSIYGR